MKPRIVTRQSNAQEYAAGWRKRLVEGWNPPGVGWGDAVRRCAALPDPVNPDKFIEIANEVNRGWAKSVVDTKCHGCDAMVARAVIVGEAEDYESSTATLCESCLVEALEALRAAGT